MVKIASAETPACHASAAETQGDCCVPAPSKPDTKSIRCCMDPIASNAGKDLKVAALSELKAVDAFGPSFLTSVYGFGEGARVLRPKAWFTPGEFFKIQIFQSAFSFHAPPCF